MVQVSKDSANWRLFGGGGLLVGGVLWLVAVVLDLAGVTGVVGWVSFVALLVIGIAHLFVAFGQTGSNGAVGALVWGKIVLVLAALGWVLIALAGLLALLGVDASGWLPLTGQILAIVAGILSSVAILTRGVAKGIAKWALFVPVVAFAIVVLLPLAGVALPAWVAIVVAALFALTGLAYLFNKADLSK